MLYHLCFPAGQKSYPQTTAPSTTSNMLKYMLRSQQVQYKTQHKYQFRHKQHNGVKHVVIALQMEARKLVKPGKNVFSARRSLIIGRDPALAGKWVAELSTDDSSETAVEPNCIVCGCKRIFRETLRARPVWFGSQCMR